MISFGEGFSTLAERRLFEATMLGQAIDHAWYSAECLYDDEDAEKRAFASAMHEKNLNECFMLILGGC